ncbi:uncharacterized protein LOC111271219 isoform X2 [Varroa jacobsoni]|uniref:uncharacterized protein LOC111271219 isoform X2 n=1 Tax=Varroa jacobsoni TaxID=62625 RepID=UPI000BF8629C|nr:uncharacterized protein LOC111271219 isoform X2 [Varroa jacobsoni]
MREVTGWALGGTLIALLLLMTSPGGDTFILPVVLFKHFPLYHHHKGIGILPVPIPIPIKHLPRVKVRIQLGGKKKKTYYHHHVSDHQDWE